VHRYYEAARNYVDFLSRNAAGGDWKSFSNDLYLQSSTGDWLCCEQLPMCGDESDNGRCNTDICPRAAASAFAHVLGVSRVVDMANAIGASADAKRFSAQLVVMKAAYHTQFFVQESGLYADVSTSGAHSSTKIQSLQVFPLSLKLVPKQYVDGVVAGLVANILAHGNHTNCGIIGARFLLEVLTEYGHEELAFALATQTSCPSWGYMVEGAGEPVRTHDTPGTIWESWQDQHTYGVSKNHPALAASIGLFVYTLAGLSSDSGGEHLILRPLPVAVRRLGSASVESSMRGGVRLSWSSDENRFRAEVEMQLGVVAMLHILLPIVARGEHVVLTESTREGAVVWSSDPATTVVDVPGVLSARLSEDSTELVVELLGGGFVLEASRVVSLQYP
jgi:alpha-L-rhamnosidase